MLLESIILAIGYLVGWSVGACRFLIYGIGSEVTSSGRRIRYGGLFQFSAGSARLGVFASFWVDLLILRTSCPLGVVGHGVGRGSQKRAGGVDRERWGWLEESMCGWDKAAAAARA
jgi:hypothetical protein